VAAGLIATSLIACAACVAAFFFFRQSRRLRDELHRTEARRLRNQLNPHFLFNTLNAISELGYRDPDAADRTITQLSNLLRVSLDTGSRHEIALKDEVDILRRYLDIQQTLLQNRLKIEFDIAPDTLTARVPSMILQPLAENAIVHGVTPAGAGGYVCVTARREADALVLTVRDNGPGVATACRERVGLGNTRTRLEHLYGAAQQFELIAAPGGGALARLRLPFHEAYAYDEDSHAYR
jgi:LytS/YehU family sensor histidine kinase